MKALILGLALISCSSFAAAGGPHNINVRCEGLNNKGVHIGLDVTLDPVERLVSLATFENESTGPIDLNQLGAPSQFIKQDAQGKVLVFGFKTFNDGLEEDMSILFVEGSPNLTSLKLGSGANNLAVKQISCHLLK